MDANEPKNTRLRSALGQLDAQNLLVHGLLKIQDPRLCRLRMHTREYAERWGHPRRLCHECICVHWRLFAAESSPHSAYSISSGGRSPPTNPRSAVNLATELFDSTGRGGTIWMVHKLHKMSDKPVSTLGFSTPGVVPKGPHSLLSRGRSTSGYGSESPNRPVRRAWQRSRAFLCDRRRLRRCGLSS